MYKNTHLKHMLVPKWLLFIPEAIFLHVCVCRLTHLHVFRREAFKGSQGVVQVPLLWRPLLLLLRFSWSFILYRTHKLLQLPVKMEDGYQPCVALLSGHNVDHSYRMSRSGFDSSHPCCSWKNTFEISIPLTKKSVDHTRFEINIYFTRHSVNLSWNNRDWHRLCLWNITCKQVFTQEQ